jgi:two-component system sensor histidine kinase KdpD
VGEPDRVTRLPGPRPLEEPVLHRRSSNHSAPVPAGQLGGAAAVEATGPTPLAGAAGVGLALVVATAAAAVLEGVVGVSDASSVYLVAVVLAAGVLGTGAAVATSVIAFLVYDFLFTTPRFTFAVSDPDEVLSLVLFLLVAVVIGRLAARMRERAEEADRRVREGVALVAISRDIAAATSFDEAAATVVDRLWSDAEMAAVWIILADEPDRRAAVAGDMPPGIDGVAPWTLVRAEADGGSDWLRVYDAAPAHASDVDEVPPFDHYLAPIEGDQGPIGAIHAIRAAGEPVPGRGARRILALAADQLGIAIRREELIEEVTRSEITQQSDALRGAILDSVSHDLRTPIAGIRALAGGLLDPAVESDPEAVRAAAAAIDAEGARLGELVASLLDMGRIQAGAIYPDLVAYDVAELAETTLRHHPPAGRGARVPVEIDDDLPPVLVDAVLFDVALGNVLDNAALHAPEGSEIRVGAALSPDGDVLLHVDDAGPGVAPDVLPLLFDRFYRVPAASEPARRGLGMGLAIARGFVEAMDGSIEAAPSDLGGLRVTLRLRPAPAERAV